MPAVVWALAKENPSTADSTETVMNEHIDVCSETNVGKRDGSSPSVFKETIDVSSKKSKSSLPQPTREEDKNGGNTADTVLVYA